MIKRIIESMTKNKTDDSVTTSDTNETELDTGFIDYSAEAVGYPDRTQQWNAYRLITSYIDPPDGTILDFGAGRGDYQKFYEQEYGQSPNYTGIEANTILVEASKRAYNDVKLVNKDWFNLDDELRGDWCINIGSLNLRYDHSTELSDIEYLQKTIEVMYDKCNIGVVVLLSSDRTEIEDSLINYNPGDVLNWATEKFTNIALDHSISADLFTLIIYK